MGKRFLGQRYPIESYPGRRAFLILHEGAYAKHTLRPYGLLSSGFTYRQMYDKKHSSRQGRITTERATKKAARQQARRQLREQECELDNE